MGERSGVSAIIGGAERLLDRPRCPCRGSTPSSFPGQFITLGSCFICTVTSDPPPPTNSRWKRRILSAAKVMATSRRQRPRQEAPSLARSWVQTGSKILRWWRHHNNSSPGLPVLRPKWRANKRLPSAPMRRYFGNIHPGVVTFS